MDAAQTLLKKTVLLLPLALFAMAPVIQAQPSFNAIGLVTLTGNGQVAVTGSADTSTPITFTASIDSTTVPSGDPSSWLSVSSTGTTPGNVNFLLVNLGQTQGTYTAVVRLHATAPAGVPDITFNVSFTSGSSGGGGQSGPITATPNPFPISSTVGSANTGTITLSTTSTAAINFTVSYNPVGTWLTVVPNQNSVSSTAGATLSINASAVGLTNQIYPGSITVTPTGGIATIIPVSFTVGSGGSGTLTATPNPVTMTFTSANGQFPSVPVTLVSSTGATTYTATASSSNGWLLVNGGVNSGTTTIASGLTASSSANITALATGNYVGNIQVTDSNFGTANIVVNLTVNGGSTTALTLSPSTGLTFNSAVGGVTTAGQQVSITSPIGGSLGVTCTSSGWLQCTGNTGVISAGSPLAITLTATPGALPSGTYSGQLSATVTGTSTLSGFIPITFVVGSGSGTGGATGLSVAPASLVFNYQAGTNILFVARQTLAITGPPGAAWTGTVQTADGGGWLSLETIQGNLSDGTGTTRVIINPTGLPIGTYTGTAFITFTGSTTQNVAVTLSVVAGPILLSTPGSLVINYHTIDPAPQPLQISLAASDGSAISATAATSTPWITVSQPATSGVFAVSVSPAGMAAGLYSGSVTVTQSGLGNSPLTIPVILLINGGSGTGGGTGALTLNPASLTFNAAVGVSPVSQSIAVTASTATNFTVAATTANGVNWLTLNQSSGITPANVGVFVNSTTLPLGTYTGTITFTTNGVNQTVSVLLNVSTTGGAGGSVTATPASLVFTGQAGAGSLTGQTLTISSTQGIAGVTFTLSTTGGSWLSTTASGGTLSTPLQTTVNVNVAGLAAGTYNGSVIITPTGGSAVAVPVTLTVTALPGVSATPTPLTFTYRAGDPAPASQPVSVTGGGASLSFTATASSSGWLLVSPASGTTPATVNVSVNPAGLNASTTPYTGTITVSGSGNASGSTTIPVSLTVTAPLPTVTGLTNAGSFLSGSISPGEIITLFGTDIGPSTAAQLALDTTGKVATSIGGVQVLVSGFPCPMIFANATQISAVVPYEIARFLTADVQVKFVGQSSNAIHVNVATTAPGLFTANSSGKGPGAILNGNSSFNSPSNPAAKGEIVAVYMTGEGQTSPPGVTGKVTTVSTTPPLTPAPLLAVSVLIGPPGAQQPANFTFAGEAPGLVSGAMQLNVQIPTTLTSSGDVPIVVSIGGNQSQTGVTVSVR